MFIDLLETGYIYKLGGTKDDWRDSQYYLGGIDNFVYYNIKIRIINTIYFNYKRKNIMSKKRRKWYN